MKDSAVDSAAVVDKVFDNLDEVEEYGYAFWVRFLTDYPKRLLQGKSQPWYFLSRLTMNDPY